MLAVVALVIVVVVVIVAAPVTLAALGTAVLAGLAAAGSVLAVAGVVGTVGLAAKVGGIATGDESVSVGWVVFDGLLMALPLVGKLAKLRGLAGAGKAANTIDDLPIPHATRLEAAEQATAGRLLKHPEYTGGRLIESPHKGAEYVDELGRSYDAMGEPKASQYWNEQKFLRAIDKHVQKSNDFTVIDLTDFAPEHIEIVRDYVNSLPPKARETIIRIGF